MIQIERNYHFYAAHRNETLADKCYNLHGHQYEVTVVLEFEEPDKSEVCMLFSDIDKVIEPYFKDMCHTLLINYDDPLRKVLEGFNIKCKRDGIPQLKMSVFPFPTSAENLAKHFHDHILSTLKLPVVEVRFKETKSGVVIYKPKKSGF
jgi:6-pyruvoyltetrahydropterin/6-carboxytetrahydropterin synthase